MASGFDPVKVLVLQMAGIASWVGIVVTLGSKSRHSESRPSIFQGWVPVVLILGACLSGIFSLDQSNSLWGSEHFRQGLFSWFCLAGLVAGVPLHLRTTEQTHRLFLSIVAGSVPVTIFALWQLVSKAAANAGMSDPTGFIGHPLYLAGYLVMVLPVTVLLLARHRTREAGPDWVRLALNSALLLQFSAFLATEKRGPLVALVVSCAAFAILAASAQHRFRRIRWVVVCTAASFALFGGLAVTGRMGVQVDEIPLVGRLSRIIPLPDRPADVFRASLWEVPQGLLLGTTPIRFVDGTNDPLGAVRWLIGFGPETLQSVLSQFWTFVPGGPAPVLESRFHNGIWDVWYSFGLLGVLGAVGAFSGIFAECMKRLRFPAWKPVFVSLGGCLVGALISGIIFGFGYAPLGISMGLIGGLVVSGFIGSIQTKRVIELNYRTSLIAAVFIGLLAHWTEWAFSFHTAGTLLLFCLFVGYVLSSTEETETNDIQSLESASALPVATGLAVGVTITASANHFLEKLSSEPLSLGGFLHRTLFESHRSIPSAAMMILIPAGCILLVIMGKTFSLKARRDFGVATGTAVTIFILYAGVRTALLTSVGAFPDISTPIDAVIEKSVVFENATLVFGVLILLSLLILPYLFVRRTESQRATPAVALFGFVGVCLVGVLLISIPFFKGQAAARFGDLLFQSGRLNAAAALLDRATVLDDADSASRDRLAMVYAKLSSVATTPEDADLLLSQAIEVLDRKPDERLPDTRDRYAAHFLTRAALRSEDPSQSAQLAASAARASERAMAFQPMSEPILFDAFIIDAHLLDREATAKANLVKANELTSQRTDFPIETAIWGDFYSIQAHEQNEPLLKAIYGRRAIYYYDRSMRERLDSLESSSPTDLNAKAGLMSDLYETAVHQARLLLMLGDPDKARSVVESAIAALYDPEPWDAHILAAQACLSQDDKVAAAAHGQRALDTAPPDIVPQIQKFLDEQGLEE